MNAYTEPNFAKSALITIDTQFDTLDGQPLEIAGTSAALPNIRALLDAYRQHRLPIIHIVRIYKRDGSNVDLCRKQAVEEGTAILLEGSERDYKIVLAEDAVSGLYPKGKEEMSNIGVHLLKTASIESAIMSS